MMDIEILQEDRLRDWCRRLQMPEGGTDALAEMAREIQGDAELLGIFNAFYEQTTLNNAWHREWSDLPVHPAVKAKLGNRTSLFYLLGYLAALPKVEREYRRLGVSLQIFNDTMLDFSLWMTEYYATRGHWGFNQFSWMWRHLDVKLFRLGRLQYMLAEFPGNVTAFRHRVTGQILLLGDPETPLRPDGYAEGAGGKPSGEQPWHAVLEGTPAGWRGNRITPEGYTMREESFMLRSKWERVLKHGDTILDLHIPRGDKLTTEECKDSLKQAFEFFPIIFPDRPFKGVYCHTWFFTPQLQKILPEDSNIVRFQREFYLYPHAGGPGFLWGFVFGDKYPDASTAPRDTFLRRAVLDWIANEGELFDMPGLMLHSPEQWGSQIYYNPTAAHKLDEVTTREDAAAREEAAAALEEPDAAPQPAAAPVVLTAPVILSDDSDLDETDGAEYEDFEHDESDTDDPENHRSETRYDESTDDASTDEEAHDRESSFYSDRLADREGSISGEDENAGDMDRDEPAQSEPDAEDNLE